MPKRTLCLEKECCNNRIDNEYRIPPLMRRKVDMTALLLESGVNVNYTDSFGDTLLHSAHTPEIAALLIDKGADINSRNINGDTPLHKLYHGLGINSQHMALLIEKGADINAVNQQGETPLHLAAHHRLLEAVDILLYYNADTSVRDNRGFTPIMYNILGHQRASERLVHEMLLRYEYNFSCSANRKPTLFTLALLKRSPYLDEMIGLGVDFSNLRRDVRILLWCIHQPDIEEFKWFWDIFDYKKSWIYCNSILEYLFRKRRYSLFDYVLGSPKMEVVIEVGYRNQYARRYLEDIDKYNFSLDTRASRRSYFEMNIGKNIEISEVLDAELYDESRAEQAIFVLLSYGFAATEEDAYRIFKRYGYGPLFELLLHLGVERIERTLLKGFPLLLSRVLLDPGTDARKYFVDYRPYRQDKMRKAKDSQGFFRDIPSLVELSRNQARVAIWNRFKMKNITQFYTTVNYMDIPPLIKDIINFKLPVYNPHLLIMGQN